MKKKQFLNDNLSKAYHIRRGVVSITSNAAQVL